LHIVADEARAQDDARMVPDADPTAQFHRIPQRDARHPFHQLEQDPVKNRGWCPDDLGLVHAPIAEPVHEHGPEPLFEEVAVMGAEILGHERPEPDAGRVAVSPPAPVRGR